MNGDKKRRSADGGAAILDGPPPSADQIEMVEILDSSPVDPEPLRSEYDSIFSRVVTELKDADPSIAKVANAEMRLETVGANTPTAGQPVTVNIVVMRNGRAVPQALVEVASVPRGAVSPSQITTSEEGTGTTQWTLPVGGDYALIATLRNPGGTTAVGALPLHVPAPAEALGDQSEAIKDQTKHRASAPREPR